ncbi:hypothetical protein [Sorangium sp. So ce406]|uniref:hypothetical protein n=1 Tax=Sorangium sp. So ce406 TaxID=3133311 RepID=UPI003F5C9583
MIRRTVCLALSTLSLTAGLVLAASASGAPLAPPAPLMVFGNKLKLEQLGFNLLTTNRHSLTALINNPLNTESFKPGAALQGVIPGTLQRGTTPQPGQRVAPGTLHKALLDPAARAVMAYMVECALGSQQSVSWTLPEGATLSAEDHENPGVVTTGGKTTITWKGAGQGLCPAWANGAPDAACQERVSACLLSRNNAFGKSYDISIQGDAVPPPRDEAERLAYQRERATYTAQEGAFFGNILDPAGLNSEAQKTYVGQAHPKTADPIYKKAFVCSPPDERELMRFGCDGAKTQLWVSSRVCAVPDRNEGCVAMNIGPCATPAPGTPPAVCTADSPQAPTYRSCTGGGRAWTQPVTVYLREEEFRSRAGICKPQPQRELLRDHGRGPGPGPDQHRDKLGPNAPDDRVRTVPGRPGAPANRANPRQAPQAQPR